MDRERKKQKNQSAVIEAQRLKELNSQTIMKIKQKIIMSGRNRRTLKVKTTRKICCERDAVRILFKMVPFQM